VGRTLLSAAFGVELDLESYLALGFQSLYAGFVVTGSKIQNKKIKSRAAHKSVRSTLTCLKLVGQVAAKEEN
jgi:hypothetical protein